MLDQFMMLYVHWVKTDKIDQVTAANEFVRQRDKRQQLFGKFTANHIPLKLSFLSKYNVEATYPMKVLVS